MAYFEIQGGKKLKGEVVIGGSKNGTVALLAGSLLNRGKTVLKNIPEIEEVTRCLEVLESIGMSVTRRGNTLTLVPPDVLLLSKINKQAAEKTRFIILLIGSLAGRQRKYLVPQAGGCRLGSRTVRPHLFALENFGMRIETQARGFSVTIKKLQAAKKIVLYESGDTVTENALLVAAQVKGKTTIRLASANYMVQELCFFLKKLGVRIQGIGTATLEVEGVGGNIRKDVIYEISEDPVEAMLFLSAAIVTKSAIVIRRCPIDFLELELLKLEKMGFRYTVLKAYTARNGRTHLVDIQTRASRLTALEDKIHPLPFPGLNIDNLPFFVPIALTAKGRTLIHDWVYEGRSLYFVELNRLGGKVTLLDPHRVSIEGPSTLTGTEMAAPPALRPAVIILVVMLAARGRSILRGVYSIQRGYERLAEKLSALGADIRLIKEN